MASPYRREKKKGDEADLETKVLRRMLAMKPKPHKPPKGDSSPESPHGFDVPYEKGKPVRGAS